MKFILPIVALITTSCSYYTIIPNGSLPSTENKISENASDLIKRMQIHEYENWKIQIQKIRDTYSRVIKALDDKETIQFTIVFFKVLSLHEDLERETLNLYDTNRLPNIDSLKFFYSAEKKLDEMIALITPFTNSADREIQYCAQETEKCFEYQKDLFSAVRDVDFRALKTSDIPSGIPPEVLRANAKFLEQRDQMSRSLISYYASLADE